ncbi:hypothetical protein F5Y07DRAFT_357633, partial [Xylaria sp. FL0933]
VYIYIYIYPSTSVLWLLGASIRCLAGLFGRKNGRWRYVLRVLTVLHWVVSGSIAPVGLSQNCMRERRLGICFWDSKCMKNG